MTTPVTITMIGLHAYTDTILMERATVSGYSTVQTSLVVVIVVLHHRQVVTMMVIVILMSKRSH